ncbi:hypothetical protein Gasu2_34220 [Galdieria sulphuraria]|nr:hypothetical protein Gasu2_34220 [Galdieria sulphuraria]
MDELSARLFDLYNRALASTDDESLRSELEEAAQLNSYFARISELLLPMEEHSALVVLAQIMYYSRIAFIPEVFATAVYSYLERLRSTSLDIMSRIDDFLSSTNNLALVIRMTENHFITSWLTSLPLPESTSLVYSLLSRLLMGTELDVALREIGASWLLDFIQVYERLTRPQQLFVMATFDYYADYDFGVRDVITYMMPYLDSLPESNLEPPALDEMDFPAQIPDLQEAISRVFAPREVGTLYSRRPPSGSRRNSPLTCQVCQEANSPLYTAFDCQDESRRHVLCESCARNCMRLSYQNPNLIRCPSCHQYETRAMDELSTRLFDLYNRALTSTANDDESLRSELEEAAQFHPHLVEISRMLLPLQEHSALVALAQFSFLLATL